MSTVDRSKFKKTVVADDKASDATVTGQGGGPSADYHKIKPGMNYHRIYPAHFDDGGKLYAVPKGVHWLPQEVPKKDKEGKLIKDGDKLVYEIANRPIFNAKIHGGKKRDIVEEYYAFAEKVALETYPDSSNKKTNEENQAARKKMLLPVVGNPQAKVYGIGLKQSWVMYTDNMVVDKDGNVTFKVLGRLDTGKAVKFRLNSLAATESANDPMGTDPFTDLDEGRAISIKYDDKATKPQDYYATEFYAPLVPGGKGQIKLYPLSDEDLAKFVTYPSLKKMFIDSYDAKQFKNALKGLKLFDDEHELGIFGYEEFLAIVEELQAEFPDSGTATEGTGEEEEEEGGGDIFDNMDRDELKAYIRENKLPIIVNKQMDDDAVREKIRELMQEEEEESEEEHGTLGEEEEDDEPEGEEDTTSKTVTKKDSKNDGSDLPFEVDETKKEVVKTKIAESTKERLARIKAEKETKGK